MANKPQILRLSGLCNCSCMLEVGSFKLPVVTAICDNEYRAQHHTWIESKQSEIIHFENFANQPKVIKCSWSAIRLLRYICLFVMFSRACEHAPGFFVQ